MLRIKVNKEDLERTEAALIGNGFSSMMIDDPDDVRDIAQHPDTYRYDYLNEALTADLERRPEITIYFADDEEGRAERARAVKILDMLGGSEDGPDLIIQSDYAGDDSEWLYKWQEYFKPARVGERIVVKPSWEEYTPAEGDLVIEMDPGMAFGSGLHETTSMCIRALEKCVVKDNSGGAHSAGRVLDVGTGTGILAICALKLGAKEAVGYDIDEWSVDNARHNAVINRVDERFTSLLGDVNILKEVKGSFDLVMANINRNILLADMPMMHEKMAPGARLILSGFYTADIPMLTEKAQSLGMTLAAQKEDNEWACLVFQN